MTVQENGIFLLQITHHPWQKEPLLGIRSAPVLKFHNSVKIQFFWLLCIQRDKINLGNQLRTTLQNF